MHSSNTKDEARIQSPEDLWLEEIEGERAMTWVREQNAATSRRLSATQVFSEVRDELREILEARDRLPALQAVWWEASKDQAWVLNVWQDAEHPQGVLRATPWKEFVERAEPNWQVWLDVDALAAKEGVSWVLHDVRPGPRPSSRAMLSLSRGGGDAVEWREFDLPERKFVEGGFHTTEAKAIVTWCDPDHLYAAWPATQDEKTDAGYPRRMRLWKRGESLASAPVVLEAPREDVLMWAYVMRELDSQGQLRAEHFLHRFVSFHESKLYWRSSNLEVREVPLPPWVDFVDVRSGQFVMYVKRPTKFGGRELRTGEVWSWDWEHWKTTGEIRNLVPLWRPSAQEAYLVAYETRDALVLMYLQDVQTRMELCRWVNGKWERTSIWGELGDAHVVVDHTSRDRSEIVVTRHHEIEPPSQWMLDLSQPELRWRKLRQSPPRFRHQGLVCERYFATSADGEKIPYRIVRPQSKTPAPTLITAYGGFESPLLPRYWSDVGKVWLERGGAFIVANIRGGSEYGPRWHQAALRENRQRAYDDLFAVTEDAIARGLSAAGQIAFRGGSNGGLLAGNALVQRPDLYQAVLIQVPLLDMLRFHRLLAGAAWISEYGTPENEADRVWLKRYSPYHQVRAGTELPEAFVTTSTRDDRVHPGHARRFAHRLRELGHRVLYFENIEGGHAGAATPAAKAELLALEYSYLLTALRLVAK